MLSFNTLYNNYILIDVNKEFRTDYQMCVTIKIIFHYILIKKILELMCRLWLARLRAVQICKPAYANDERSNRCQVKLSAVRQYNENPLKVL